MERDSRPKHIAAWAKNAAENFCMPSAFVRVRASASACVHVCASACVRVQKIIRPDASRRVFCSRTFWTYYTFRLGGQESGKLPVQFWFQYFEITVMSCQLDCEFKSALETANSEIAYSYSFR